MADSKLVRSAQDGGKMGKTAPAGGGRDTMPKGDGLKRAWADQTSKPSVLTNMDAAKKRVK
jgi:hypothetical protein